ncbi:HD domain-containing protein [Cryptosporangium phraense]|uniref:HD domain-containing protein n=1 Tax=Cryptosporangium phraense TaxID=2593070 RepID=A0A545AWG6_9ACTN|nr:HD domain-containing protein [Cryptosporangium phraense]TQS45672.1 HD domain-containing protein [Cryptosporangium phraense]
MTETACAFGVKDAEELARTLLHPLTERWQHTAAVAVRAEQLAGTVDAADREILVAAAWLHDIGYATATHDSGFHPLDGARYLRKRGVSERLCSLVAHHSGARFVAEARGLTSELAEFPLEVSALSDALTYADQTVGPHGRPYSVEQRMAEVLDRHGPESPQAKAYSTRAPYLLSVAERVRRRFAQYSQR